ncbi:MAG: TonB-dependent receptor [Bacteroidales bacterium]|nr:TonB-dependent receptor [Bacteroidales bacterium]
MVIRKNLIPLIIVIGLLSIQGLKAETNDNKDLLSRTTNKEKENSLDGNFKGYKTDSVQHIQEIVVTGTNLATKKNLLPYSISIVSGTKIENSGENNVLKILSGRVPGMFVTERGVGGFGISTGGSGGIKIRGVGGSPTSQVLMMVDGQPQFAGIYSHHVADSYTSDYVEKVEVIRGPASVLYGSNAMGGAVNIITKHAITDGVFNNLSAMYGSYNTSRFNYSNMVKHGRFSSVLTLNYENSDGIKKDFDFSKGGGYAKVGYDFSDNWSANIDYNLMKFAGNDPTYITEDSPEPYHQNILRGAGSLNLNNNYGTTSGSIKMFYSYGNHFIKDPKPFHSTDDHLGVIAYQSFSLFNGNAVTAGFDFTNYSGRIPLSGGTAHTEGSMSTISKKTVTESAPYIVVAQSFLDELFSLNAGLRYVINDKFGNKLVPQGGITLFPLSDNIIKASLAKGYRNPSFRELYLYRPANPDLKSEEMMNYEISYTRYMLEKTLMFELTGYWSKGSDLIQTVAKPELGHPLNENTGSFINKGIEVSFAYHVLENLNFNSSYSYMNSSLKNLTGAPKNQFFFGVDYKPINKLKVDLQVRNIGGLYVASDINNQNYTLLDANISYYAADNIEVFAKIDNILNQRYYINYGYEMPGILAFGGVRLKF